MDIVYNTSNHHFKEFVRRHLEHDAYTCPLILRMLPYSNYLQLLLYQRLKTTQILTVPYKHETIHLSENVTTCVFSFKPARFSSNTPILLFFPTITSHVSYFHDLVEHVVRVKGWAMIIINKRGQHCPLTSYEFHLTGDDHDNHVVIEWVSQRYPHNPYVAYGISAGAISLSRYLGNKKPTSIIAAGTLGGALCQQMVRNMCPTVMSHLKGEVYNMYRLPEPVTRREAQICARYQHWFKTDHLTLLDLPVTLGQLSAAELKEHYDVTTAIKDIQTPTIVFTAEDDPVFPEASHYIPNYIGNTQLLFVNTKYGSHCCYFAGVTNSGLSWVHQKVLNFLEYFLLRTKRKLKEKIKAH